MEASRVTCITIPVNTLIDRELEWGARSILPSCSYSLRAETSSPKGRSQGRSPMLRPTRSVLKSLFTIAIKNLFCVEIPASVRPGPTGSRRAGRRTPGCRKRLHRRQSAEPGYQEVMCLSLSPQTYSSEHPPFLTLPLEPN